MMKQKSNNIRNMRMRRGRTLLHRARFLPAIVITGFAAYLSLSPYFAAAQNKDVLAYATDVSAAGLLLSTNSQRAANGKSALTANGQLNTAAQAKANDMVNRNYWSHQTPDGQQPWVFIANAGYQYSSAGENLAYGFMNSADTITGWMNSPSHKANLLSSSYTEVGFGFANSSNFVNNGQQTIVVAMYAKPLVAAAPAQASTPPAQPKAAVKPVETAPVTQAAPVEATPAEEPAPTEPAEETITTAALEETDQPLTAAPTQVQRVNLLQGNFAGLSVALVFTAVVASLGLWALHKGFHLKRYLTSGEKFIANHIHLDFTVLAILYLGVVLLSTSGNIL